MERTYGPVGRYALDLLLKDAQGRVVIVENQLERTDHGHLGQLLTYCAGTQAEIVIWIAHSVTEEHAAALEWLNDNTITGVGFFGVEVEAVRIGDSAPAPNFKVVVRPSNWAKNSRRGATHVSAWTWDAYESELRVPAERIKVGRELVEAITAAIEEREWGWTIEPGIPLPDINALLDLIQPFHPTSGPMTAPPSHQSPGASP